MPSQPKSTQPAFLLAGVLFSAIALVALIALLMLKSKADSTFQQAGVGNTPPAIDSIAAVDQDDTDIIDGTFTPVEGLYNANSYKTITVTLNLRDDNGCHNIKGGYVVVHLKNDTELTPVCQPGETAEAYCYGASFYFEDLTGCDSPDDTTAVATLELPIANFVMPTDAGSPQGELGSYWEIGASVTDESLVTTEDYRTFTVASLAAFSTLDSISYGQLNLDEVSDSQTMPFYNTGNLDVDAYVAAYWDNLAHDPPYPPYDGDMHSNLGPQFDIIPALNVHYSLADFTYHEFIIPPSDEYSVTKDGELFPLDLSVQDTDGAQNIPSKDTYWKLKLPASGVNGTYQNTLVFTAQAVPTLVQVQPLEQLGSIDYSGSFGVENLYTRQDDMSSSVVFVSADNAATLIGIDANPLNPTQVGTIDNILSSDVTAITADMDNMYLSSSDASNNFQIINNQTGGISSTITAISGGVSDMAVYGQYAFLVGGNNKFVVVDLVDPENPGVVAGSQISFDYVVKSVKISGEYAIVYTTDDPESPEPHHGHLYMVDIANPASPSIQGSSFQTYPDAQMDIPHGTTSIFGPSYVFIAGSDGDLANTLQIVDVTNPVDMFEANSLSINNNPVVSMSAYGDYVYVADNGQGVGSYSLNAYNVSNPDDMSVDASVDAGIFKVNRILATQSYVYIADKTDGIFKILSGMSGGRINNGGGGKGGSCNNDGICSRDENVDSCRADCGGVQPLSPYIDKLTPSAAAPGGSDFTLVIDGENFTNTDDVYWNGSRRETTYISSTQLEATITSDDIVTEGTADVQIMNSKFGTSSNTVQFSVALN